MTFIRCTEDDVLPHICHGLILAKDTHLNMYEERDNQLAPPVPTQKLDDFLDKNGLTLCIHNLRFRILGLHANRFLFSVAGVVRRFFPG